MKRAVPVRSAAVPPLLLLAAAGGVLFPAPSSAQTASAVAGVNLPGGGRPLPTGDASRAGFGRLLADLAAEVRLPAGDGSAAEVYVWSGDDYKPGRTGFRRSALRSALAAAGYEVKEYESSDLMVTPFHEKYALTPTDDENAAPRGSVRIWSADTTHWFRAVNPKSQTALVGLWADSGTDNRLVLALALAGYKGAKPAAALPGLPTGAVLVQDPEDVMRGVAPLPPPAFPKLAKRPGYVRGVVKDGSGKPIAGAKLVAWSSALGGFRTEARGTTDAQGVYAIKLPAGVCQVVNADCRVRRGGREYLLPLHPADGEREHFDSKAGAVENFFLRTSGATSPDGSAYGGTIRLLEWVPETGDAAQDGTLEVTLAPEGPLFDGSAGRTFVYRFANGPAGERFLRNVPAGRYKLTAALLDGGERLPLRARKTFGNAPGADSLIVEFESEGGAGALASLGRSGFQRFDVTLEP